jgi:putative ABC transport system substrate-binding protein
MMRRREFITLLGGAAVTWPLAARGQKPAMPLIGMLDSVSGFGDIAFLQGLREAGFVEGQNVVIERRRAGGAYERLPALAAELVALRVDLMATFGTPAVRVAKAASVKSVPAIPVVFAMGADPVAEGLVESLNRPGGNITGVVSIAGALASKLLELMREFLRDDAALALLINPGNPISGTFRQDTEAASRVVGQRLEVLTAGNAGEIEQAFAALKPRRVGALIIAVDTFFFTQMQRMATLAAQYRMPTIGPLREFAVEGGLLSYGPSIPEVVRQAGVLAGKILKGARPADLPVQQPTKFELVVNLKTARALGIELSPKLLALADEVIE